MALTCWLSNRRKVKAAAATERSEAKTKTARFLFNTPNIPKRSLTSFNFGMTSPGSCADSSCAPAGPLCGATRS